MCGGTSFVQNPVLWQDLITQWQLGPAEVAYVNRQQGTACTRCDARLRCIALANAIRTVVGTTGRLIDFVQTQAAGKLAILEINEAGTLSPTLSRMPGHVLAEFPDVDIHAMPFDYCTFDLVVHADTLEHVTNSVAALSECRRVLKPGGALCFTAPTIVGRLTRSRAGLPPSYHGFPGTAREDYVVHTEFGVDIWTCLIQASFDAVSIVTVDYPPATAFMARRNE
jgi:SAM-dependent methyltransferase